MEKKTISGRIQRIRHEASLHLHSVLDSCDSINRWLVYNAIQKLDQCDIRIHPKCSFTLDKRIIYLKLDNFLGVTYDDCVIVKVLIHELAHMLHTRYGHDDEFWRINRILYPGRFGCPVPPDYGCITTSVEPSVVDIRV